MENHLQLTVHSRPTGIVIYIRPVACAKKRPSRHTMDPVTAIGVASVAISFLEFTITVYTTFHEIKSSVGGIRKEDADIREAEEKMQEHVGAFKEAKERSDPPSAGTEPRAIHREEYQYLTKADGSAR